MTVEDALGLFPASSFRIVTGATAGERTLRQARWYFNGETVAVPVRRCTACVVWQRRRDVRGRARVGRIAYGATRSSIRRSCGSARRMSCATHACPPTAAPSTAWRCGPSASCRSTARTTTQHSVAYFAGRPLTVRGTRDGDAFELRTVWPDDFSLSHRPPLRAMDAPPALAMRTLMRESPEGGSRSPYAAWTLWQREDAPDWSGPARAGVDRQRRAGRRRRGACRPLRDRDRPRATPTAASATGSSTTSTRSTRRARKASSRRRCRSTPISATSTAARAGIGRATCSSLVLRDARAAALVQSALGRVYNQFYRHQLALLPPGRQLHEHQRRYVARARLAHSAARADVALAAGWLAFPLMIAKERSLARAKIAFDYLCTDQTRLLPAAALEDAYASVHGARAAASAATDDSGACSRRTSTAIAFLRIPQFPSSRAFGDAPAVSLREYQARLPADRSQMQIVPVPPRPFPGSAARRRSPEARGRIRRTSQRAHGAPSPWRASPSLALPHAAQASLI